MGSPQMYDLSDALVKAVNYTELPGKEQTGGIQVNSFGELTDLGATEVSLDLQALVSDPHFSEGIFSDIVEESQRLEAAGGAAAGPEPLPQQYQPYQGYQPPQQPQLVKKEDPESREYLNCVQQLSPSSGAAGGYGAGSTGSMLYSQAYTTLTPASAQVPLLSPGSCSSRSGASTPPRTKSSSSSSKRVDRASDEYRRRRERNNVAVRKSREKAKQRSLETEERVKYLSRENDQLRKRVENLSKELSVLKNLFGNVGVLPEQLHREIAKHLGDSYNRPQPSDRL